MKVRGKPGAVKIELSYDGRLSVQLDHENGTDTVLCVWVEKGVTAMVRQPIDWDETEKPPGTGGDSRVRGNEYNE